MQKHINHILDCYNITKTFINLYPELMPLDIPD